MEDLKKVVAPVLYLTNTTNPLHLYESAKKTGAGLSNTKVEFVEFKNCGLVAMDEKDKTSLQIR
jgi:hypothetical protein